MFVSHASVTIFIRLASWYFMVMFTHNKALSCKLSIGVRPKHGSTTHEPLFW